MYTVKCHSYKNINSKLTNQLLIYKQSVQQPLVISAILSHLKSDIFCEAAGGYKKLMRNAVSYCTNDACLYVQYPDMMPEVEMLR